MGRSDVLAKRTAVFRDVRKAPIYADDEVDFEEMDDEVGAGDDDDDDDDDDD